MKILIALITGIAYNTTYNVSVRAKVNGSWGEYGVVCTITTPSIANRFTENQSVLNDLNTNMEISIFPNPTRKGESFNVALSANDNLNGTSISVYNIIGQIVFTSQINVDANEYLLNISTGSMQRIEQINKFNAGLYIILAEKNGEVKRVKLIVE